MTQKTSKDNFKDNHEADCEAENDIFTDECDCETGETVELKKSDFETMKTQFAEMAQALQSATEAAEKEKSRALELAAMVKRVQGEFDNYRKRTNETNKTVRTEGQADVILKLIGIMDVFEQALKHIPDNSVAEGVNMIYRQFMEVLYSFGVEEIDALGHQFDPEMHNAIMREECEDADEGEIIEVFNAGFRMGDKILRHSVVKIAT